MTNNDLQNITHKTNDRVTRMPLKPEWTSVLRNGKQFISALSSDHKLTMGSTTTLKWVIAPITTSCVNVSRGYYLYFSL